MPKLPIPQIRPWQQHTCNRPTNAGTVVLPSTAATSGSTTTIVVSTATWTTNQYQNFWVTILTGTGAGQTRNITSNNGTTLTVPTWTAPDNTSTFQITQPQYPGLQGSLAPGAPTSAVLANVTYREVVPTAGSAELTVRLKTTTAVGTLTITPIRLLAATNPDDPAITDGLGNVDTTKVQKYSTGGSTATAVVAGTELALSINPAGEAYCLLEFACTTAGTLNYCDVMALQTPGNVTTTGGGGGSSAVTIADGAAVTLGTTTDAVVTAATGAAATAISLLKGIDNGINATPANPPPFQLELNDGTPVGDTAAHAFFVKTGGNIADGSAATGSLASLVGGVDNAGTPVVRTMQVVPMNASPATASTFGVLTFAAMSCLSSGFQNPVKSIGSIGSGTTGLFAGSTGLIGYNGSTYDVIKSVSQALQVAGTSTSIQSTLTVSTSPAYTAGDNVGGIVTLTNAMRYSGGTGVLQNLLVVDHSNQKPNLDILFFKSTPAATFTDNGAFPTLSQADDALVVCRISIAASDWVSVGGSGFTAVTFQPKVVAASGSANLLMALNTSSTPTFVATTDIMVTTGFLQD